MISNETLESIQCCLSVNDHHFVQSPIGMSCGHYICKKCIPTNSDDPLVKCSFCNEINVNNLSKSRESSGIKTLIKVLIDSLFKLVDEKYDCTLTKLLDCKNNYENFIEIKIESIENEMKSRVEILKNELDALLEHLKDELKIQKDKLLKDNQIVDELKRFEEKFKDLKEENDKNELKLFEFDDYLTHTNEKIIKLSSFEEPQIPFKVSSFKLQIENIGSFSNYNDENQAEFIDELETATSKFNYHTEYLNLKEKYLDLTEQCELLRRENYELKSKLEYTKLISNNEKEQLDKVVRDLKKNIDDLKQAQQKHQNKTTLLTTIQNNHTNSIQPTLSYGQYEYETLRAKLISKQFKIIDVNIEAFDLCVLPNDQLLVVSYDDCSLSVFNKNFELQRVITKINNATFRPISVCTNMSDRLYISDIDNRRLIMTDLNFNLIKYSINLNSPRGLCFHRNYVYVCESGNNRISRFDYNLDSYTYFYVYDYPWQIKILNSLACVMHGGSSIRFYDVSYEQFKLLAQYNGHSGDILSLTSYFIEHSIDLKKFLVYDKDGCKIDEIKNDGFNGLIQKHNSYHGIVYFNESLVMTTRDTKKLILI